MTQQQHIEISPSILAADFGYLADEARRLEEAGADSIHIDVMDGNFANNLTMGSRAVAAINRATDIFLDVHIMVYRPYEYIERFVEAGADRITFHFEATEDVDETLEYIRRCNIEAGLAFNPETSPSLAIRYLDRCDLMLFMSVNPGFGGQEFMHDVLEKVRFIRDTSDKLDIMKGGVVAQNEEDRASMSPFVIQMDGGINAETAALCRDAGANSLVAGTDVFQDDEMVYAIESLRG